MLGAMKDPTDTPGKFSEQLVSDRWVHARVRHSARAVMNRFGEPAASLHDLTQDAWVVLLERAKSYDARRSSVRTFVCRVLTWWSASKSRTLARRKRSEQRALMVERHATSSATPSERVDNEELLSMLTANERVAAEFAVRWGIAGAAERLGVHRSTVHRRLSRIRSGLADAI